MSCIVVCSSKTGNTKKVAKVIAEVLGTEVKSPKDKVDLASCDLLCVGSGVYARRPGGDMVKFLNGLEGMKGKKAAVFGTYGGETAAMDKMKDMLKAKGAEVTGTFGCPGKMFGILGGRPNEKDLEDARKFAEGLKGKS